MPDSWKYAQVLRFPQSDLCECGHTESHHSGRRGYCYKCLWGEYDDRPDIADDPPSDVYGWLFPESIPRTNRMCERFRRWSPKRIKAFWDVANIMTWLEHGKEQTMLDDFSADPNNWNMWTRGYWRYRPI